jgi:hypothetical protein
MLLLFPRKGKHSRDAINAFTILIIEIDPDELPVITYDSK